MSNIKISQLPSAGALSGSEILPIVQAGDTKSTSINSIVGKVPTPTLQQILDNNHDLTDGNNFQGTGAGVNNTGTEVIGFGINTASLNSGAVINALGNASAYNNSGTNINAIGKYAATDNSGSNVNGLGFQAANSNSVDNVNAFGYRAGYNNSGINANMFGIQAGVNNTYNSVVLFGSNANANADKQLVLAEDSIQARISYINVTTDRTYQLPDASGTLALLSDIPSSSGWGLTGNAGTTPGTNFIGTTDNKDFVVKVNNQERLRIDATYGDVLTNSSFRAYGTITSVQATSDSGNGYALLAQDNTYKGYLALGNGTGGNAELLCQNLTDTRTYQLPNASGTLALTSDIGGGYKSYVAIVDFSGSGFTQSILKNDFSGITFTWSNPSTSVLRITPSTAVTFTNDKTVAFVNSYENEYFVTPKRANNPALDYINLSHTKYDGTTNTMVYGKFYIEIRVYP